MKSAVELKLSLGLVMFASKVLISVLEGTLVSMEDVPSQVFAQVMFARKVLTSVFSGPPVSMEDVPSQVNHVPTFVSQEATVAVRMSAVMARVVREVSGIPIGNTALWTVLLLTVLVAAAVLSLGTTPTLRQKHVAANQRLTGFTKAVWTSLISVLARTIMMSWNW